MSAQHFLARARAVAPGRHLDADARLRLGALHAGEVVVAHALILPVASDGADGISVFQLLCFVIQATFIHHLTVLINRREASHFISKINITQRWNPCGEWPISHQQIAKTTVHTDAFNYFEIFNKGIRNVAENYMVTFSCCSCNLKLYRSAIINIIWVWVFQFSFMIKKIYCWNELYTIR